MAILTLAAACKPTQKAEPLEIDNRLTEQEISEGLLTPEVMWKMGRISSSSLSPDGTTVLYSVTRYSMKENRGVSVIATQELGSQLKCELTDYSSNNVSPRWSSDSRSIYFMSNREEGMQLWRMDRDGKNLKRLTGVEGGIEDYGVSPDGKHLFYIKAVHVKDIRSADVHKDMDKSKARIYDDLMCRHWDYWDEGEYRHIFIAQIDNNGISNVRDITGQDSAWDTPLSPYFDSSEISWNHSGTVLAYTCKPLTGTEFAISVDSDIYVYDLTDGSTRNINKPEGYQALKAQGTDPRQMPFAGYDRYPVWSPDDSMIAFASQRRFGNESDRERLFIYNTQTSEMRELNPDFDFNAEHITWADNETLYFISQLQGTQQLCRTSLNGTGVEMVTSGQHDINAFSISQGACVVELCSMRQATELYSLDTQSGALTQISFENQQIYDNISMGDVVPRWTRTTDGKQMLSWVILPPQFNPQKRYPVLLYCQGGPQSTVSQFWSYRWNFQLMAAQGYVVIAPNRRGLPSFGTEWLDQISGDYSGQNIRDYLSAIDDIKQEKWIDDQKMGCVGASYGGYSVYYLAGCHEGRFKAFISHCGIFNFESMYGETEELWFVNNDYGGAYWEKQNATAQRSYDNSPHKSAAKWDTPILIFTGEYDFRIPYTQSLQAFTAARMRGIPARLVEFENEAHQVFKPQNSMVWNREFFSWLDRYLKQ